MTTSCNMHDCFWGQLMDPQTVSDKRTTTHFCQCGVQAYHISWHMSYFKFWHLEMWPILSDKIKKNVCEKIKFHTNASKTWLCQMKCYRCCCFIRCNSKKEITYKSYENKWQVPSKIKIWLNDDHYKASTPYTARLLTADKKGKFINV